MEHLLVVDDSETDRETLTRLLQKESDWSATVVESAEDALHFLEQVQPDLPDIVITDMVMPDIDGLELIDRIRIAYPGLPVILMTGYGSEEVMVKALRKGAASYVPKQSLNEDLVVSATAVLDMTHEDREEQLVEQYLNAIEWHYILTNDPDLIGPLVLRLQKKIAQMRLCDETDLMQVNIALGEAFMNAIYHGNLELDSSLRQPDSNVYRTLARERSAQPPYQDRSVYFTARLSREEAVFIIRDEGHGFAPGSVPDPTDPHNLDKLSGRGLLLIRTFMDEVTHNEVGNEITMVLRKKGNETS